jgi:hypothetical protein
MGQIQSNLVQLSLVKGNSSSNKGSFPLQRGKNYSARNADSEFYKKAFGHSTKLSSQEYRPRKAENDMKVF